MIILPDGFSEETTTFKKAEVAIILGSGSGCEKILYSGSGSGSSWLLKCGSGSRIGWFEALIRNSPLLETLFYGPTVELPRAWFLGILTKWLRTDQCTDGQALLRSNFADNLHSTTSQMQPSNLLSDPLLRAFSCSWCLFLCFCFPPAQK